MSDSKGREDQQDGRQKKAANRLKRTRRSKRGLNTGDHGIELRQGKERDWCLIDHECK